MMRNKETGEHTTIIREDLARQPKPAEPEKQVEPEKEVEQLLQPEVIDYGYASEVNEDDKS